MPDESDTRSNRPLLPHPAWGRSRPPLDSSAIAIRPATSADAARAGELVRDAYAKYVERMGREPRPMTEDYAVVVREKHCFVFEADGEVVGFLALEYDADEEGFMVDNVAVDPPRRGTGVGRALLEHAEAEALRRGHDELLLYTHETMTENIALYTRVGYVEYKRVPVDPGEIVCMRKPLRAPPI
jgi:GNAT superfamily N-acetyltransferase